MLEEEFKEIQNFPNYLISNYGYVLDISKNKQVKTYLCKKSLIVQLKNEQTTKKFLIHRLVATYFLKNENNYFFINHKDNNPENNNVENLQFEIFFKNKKKKKTSIFVFDEIITFD